MSWFTDIAGKAEQMLEKLDKNAAAAFHAELPVSSRVIPIEDPEEQHPAPQTEPPSEDIPSASPRKSTLAQLRGSRTNILKATRRKPNQDEEKNLLMSYLNSPSTSIEIDQSSSLSSDPDIPDGRNNQQLKTENTFLKSEIQSLNFEISRLLQKAKQGERDQQELINKQARIAELESSLHVTRSESQRVAKELQELQALKSESHFELSSEISRLGRTVKEYEARAATLAETTARLETERSDIVAELDEVKDNFEKYRARAQSVLNEKDNLIARLRAGSLEDEAAKELENEEIVLLRQGSQQLSAELTTLRTILASREEEKIQSSRLLLETQANVEILNQRLSASDNELRFQKEENQKLRDDIVHSQRELERLREAAVRVPSPPATQRTWSQDAAPDYVMDLDSKVRSLTATLVKKQQTVELLTAERNALRLQLEKAEHKLQDATRLYDRGLPTDVNTTDDAKVRQGTLRERLGLGETTGVTRSMRRAYAALGMATGNLVRRHPLARFFLIVYLLVLHLWVFGLLFSYTPDQALTTPNL